MKTLILFLSLFPFLSQASDLITQGDFQKLSDEKKVEVIAAYKEFIGEVIKNSEDDLEGLSASLTLSFFDEAFAAGKYNCFYAGWPSVKKVVTVKGVKKTFCTSPAKANSEYKNLSKSCGKSQMLCQPALFGPKLCIGAGTQSERNSAFSQCQKKFTASGKTLADLAKEISNSGLSSLADEMFSLAHDVCSTGFQSKTGMCTNLKRKISAIKESGKKPEKVAVGPKKEVPVKVQVVDKGHAVEDEALKKKLINVVKKVEENTAPVISKEIHRDIACAQCEQLKAAENDAEVRAKHEASEPIDQDKTTENDFCAGNEKGGARNNYFQSIHSDRENQMSLDIDYQEKKGDKENRIPQGYSVNAQKMGSGFSLFEDGQEVTDSRAGTLYPQRKYSNAYEGRGKENVFEIEDAPVKTVYSGDNINERYNSTDIRITQYSFFPRKVVPSVKLREDKIIMNMTTGEEIVVNAKTGKFISGAGKETPAKDRVENRVDKKGNKNTRIYPDTDFTYQGDALFIESKLSANTDQRLPGSVVPVKAYVDGKLQECKLKSEELWVHHEGYSLPKDDKNYEASKWSCTKFKFEKDEDLYSLVKKKCPSFKFPALVK